MEIKKEYLIGTIIVLVIAGTVTLYPNFFRLQLLLHPDQNFIVIHQPDKDEINIIQRISGTDFNRYRVTSDEVCQYHGSRKLACYRFYLDYWRTYGEDLWFNQYRKSSLIRMEADEKEYMVHVYKITPFYSTTRSGSDGQMIETIDLYQDHTDYKLFYTPEQVNRIHRIRMKISDLKEFDIPFDYGDQTTIRFDDEYNFTFSWDGVQDSFDHHEYDSENNILWLYFKPRKGEIRIG